MIGEQRTPRIVGVSRNQKSLMDYRESGDYVPYRREHSQLFKEAKLLFTDHEIKMLVLWAIISPSAGLAYLIWSKYEHWRVLAVVLFGVSIVQFIVQWQGAYQLVYRFLNP